MAYILLKSGLADTVVPLKAALGEHRKGGWEEINYQNSIFLNVDDCRMKNLLFYSEGTQLKFFIDRFIFSYLHDPHRCEKYAAELSPLQKKFLRDIFGVDFQMFGFSDELLR